MRRTGSGQRTVAYGVIVCVLSNYGNVESITYERHIVDVGTEIIGNKLKINPGGLPGEAEVQSAPAALVPITSPRF